MNRLPRGVFKDSIIANERCKQKHQFNPREMKHLGSRVQNQILQHLERCTELSFENDANQRSEAAMALAISCLEEFCGLKREDALHWILLSAALGNSQAMSHVYRISRALGLYEIYEQEVLAYATQSGKNGCLIAIEDLMTARPDEGREILATRREEQRTQCE
jgi:hypothetical protein